MSEPKKQYPSIPPLPTQKRKRSSPLVDALLKNPTTHAQRTIKPVYLEFSWRIQETRPKRLKWVPAEYPCLAYRQCSVQGPLCSSNSQPNETSCASRYPFLRAVAREKSTGMNENEKVNKFRIGKRRGTGWQGQRPWGTVE